MWKSYNLIERQDFAGVNCNCCQVHPEWEWERERGRSQPQQPAGSTRTYRVFITLNFYKARSSFCNSSIPVGISHWISVCVHFCFVSEWICQFVGNFCLVPNHWTDWKFLINKRQNKTNERTSSHFTVLTHVWNSMTQRAMAHNNNSKMSQSPFENRKNNDTRIIDTVCKRFNPLIHQPNRNPNKS